MMVESGMGHGQINSDGKSGPPKKGKMGVLSHFSPMIRGKTTTNPIRSRRGPIGHTESSYFDWGITVMGD